MGARPPRAAEPERAEQEDDDALNVRARIENIYAHRGFASIDPADLRGRFRWWGLYTQRKPGIDGGKTAILEPTSWTTSTSCSGSGSTAASSPSSSCGPSPTSPPPTHATPPTSPTGRTSSCTGSGSRTCRRSGSGSRRSGSTPPRPAATSRGWCSAPGRRHRRGRDHRPDAGDPRDRRQVHRQHRVLQPAAEVQDRDHRPPVARRRHEVNDISFVGVVHPEHGPGFDLWVGGGLSTNPMLAQRLGAWVPLDEVPEVWGGVASIFRDYGYRRLRTRARLKFLVADWGVEKFREVLENEVPQAHADRRTGARDPRRTAVTTSASTGSGTASSTSASAPVVGRVSGADLAKFADVVEAHGSDRVRTTAYQKLLVLDVEPDAGRLAGRRAGRARVARRSRRPGGGTRWPAPGSSSASWRSSRPRPGRPS